MLKHLAEEARYVEITGFANVEAEKPERLLKSIRGSKNADVSIQFFNANLIATWEHLYFAVLDALKAFSSKRNISKNLAVEIIVYASAQRQIRKAIEFVGIKSSCTNVAVIIVSNNSGAVEVGVSSVSKYFGKEPDERVLDLTPTKTENIRKAFAITDAEMAIVTKNNDVNRALVDLVIERMALLSTRL